MIPLAIPNLTGNEKNYLCTAIDTTYVSSVGQYVTQLEERLAIVTGSTNAVATSAGTTGLHAALTAVGVSHDDLVILPTFTFIASANSIRHCGADPWLMDVSSVDWCLDPKLVRDEIEKNCEVKDGKLIHRVSGRKVAALMPVYTLGAIPDMNAFRAIANEYHLPLIVDAACAIGAMFKGGNFGTLADLSVLSFNGNKTVTCGGGGAVVYSASSDRPEVQKWGERVRHLTTTARVWPDYDFDEVGFNYRMTNIQAAVGCAQIERLTDFLAAKRRIRVYYKERLSKLISRGITFFPMPDGCSCWFSGLVLPESSTLADVKRIAGELKEWNIEARPFWKPVHLQVPYFSCPTSVGIREGKGVSNSLWDRILTLPCSTNITDEELRIVTDAVLEVLKC